MQTTTTTTRSTVRWIAGGLLLLLGACLLLAAIVAAVRPQTFSFAQPAAVQPASAPTNPVDAALAARTPSTSENARLNSTGTVVMIFTGDTPTDEMYDVKPSYSATRAQLSGNNIAIFNGLGELVLTIDRTGTELPAELPQVDNSGTTTETITLAPTVAATAAPIDLTVRFSDGVAVSADELAARIGGDPRGWTPRCDGTLPASECSTWGYWNIMEDGTKLITFVPNTIQDAMFTYWGGFVPSGKEFKVQDHDLGDPTVNSASLKGCWAEFTAEENVNDTTFSIQCPAPVRNLEQAVTGPIDGLGVHFPSR